MRLTTSSCHSAGPVAGEPEERISGAQIVSLMRQHHATIRSLAARMNITLTRVREVRAKGVQGALNCQDWREAIKG